MDRPVSLQFQELILNHILTLPQNKYCADCNQPNPDWISLSFGVFICYKCSGIHRSLGVQKTRVKSVKLDSLTLKQLFYMAYLNNEIANEYWEAKLPPNVKRPGANSSPKDAVNFIRAKYVDKAFIDPDKESPIERTHIRVKGEDEQKENKSIEEFFITKQVELKKLLKMRVVTSKPVPPLLFAPQSKEPKTKSARIPKTNQKGNPRAGPLTPSTETNRKFHFPLGLDPKSPISASGALFTSTSFNHINLPLFEGLTLRSRGSNCSPGVDSKRESTQNFQAPSIKFFGDISLKNSPSANILSKESFNDTRVTAFPSIEFIDLKDHKPSEEQQDDKVTPQAREKTNTPIFQSPEETLLRETPTNSQFQAKCLEIVKESELMKTIIEKEDVSGIETPKVTLKMTSKLNSRASSWANRDLDRHQSITVTLQEAQNDISHLKRPSEAFQTSEALKSEERIIKLLQQRSQKYPKFLVIMNCLLIHLLLGLMYSWGAISPYIGSLLSHKYNYKNFVEYLELSGCNVLLFFGIAIGNTFSEKFVNVFGMRLVSLICFVSISSVIFIATLTVNAFVYSVLLTLLPGLFIGIMYQIPFYCAIQYFYYPGPLKIFFYLANGVGAFLFINFNLILLWLLGSAEELMKTPQNGIIHYYSDKVLAHVPTFLQLISLSFLVLGLIASYFLHPRLNFVEKNWFSWEEKEESLLSRNNRILVENLSEYGSSEQQGAIERSAESKASKLLFTVTLFYFTLSGFLFYSYKLLGLYYFYSDALMSFIGGIGVIIMSIGNAFGVLFYRRTEFRLTLKVTLVIQVIIGTTCFLFNDNDIIFLVSFLSLMFIHGIGYSLLIDEASLAFNKNENSLMEEVVILAYALSNLLSFAILKVLILVDLEDWVYLTLTIPLLLAFGALTRYPASNGSPQRMSSLKIVKKSSAAL